MRSKIEMVSPPKLKALQRRRLWINAEGSATVLPPKPPPPPPAAYDGEEPPFSPPPAPAQLLPRHALAAVHHDAGAFKKDGESKERPDWIGGGIRRGRRPRDSNRPIEAKPWFMLWRDKLEARRRNKGKKGSRNPTPPTPPNKKELREFLHGIDDDVVEMVGTSAAGSGFDGETGMGGEDDGIASTDSLSQSPLVDEEINEIELQKDKSNPADIELQSKEVNLQKVSVREDCFYTRLLGTKTANHCNEVNLDIPTANQKKVSAKEPACVPTAKSEATRRLQQVIKDSHSMKLQQSKQEWLTEGDKGSKIFFAWIKKRRLQNQLLSINTDKGEMIEGTERIAKVFEQFYTRLLGTKTATTGVNESIIKSGNVLNTEQQLKLIQPFSPQQIKEALFSIPSSKSPGPDGYNSGFFKNQWNVELAKGYKRKNNSPRCMMKLDIQKAYDTRYDDISRPDPIIPSPITHTLMETKGLRFKHYDPF
ncbi:unnamed protein product [Cuscuta campestris]|uniref:Reverse transcriptase domain-containing protein n=1 Tax=Cuscuta campestris TaxID=132261 RepID=A0A484MNZ3_9ASTE|nr:unnamed protein product [Cuscuta campestris]